jgi:hypothetical protein
MGKKIMSQELQTKKDGMKKKHSKRCRIPSTALLGKGWRVEASLPWTWISVNGGDGHGGRAPKNPDTVYMTAWIGDDDATLLAKTTIFDIVRDCVDESTFAGKFSRDRTPRDFERLRQSLLKSVKYISDAMPDKEAI